MVDSQLKVRMERFIVKKPVNRPMHLFEFNTGKPWHCRDVNQVATDTGTDTGHASIPE